MATEPRVLPAGWVLSNRFEVLATVGRGGFAIVYRAKDLGRKDTAIVRELAPLGCIRGGENAMRFPQMSPEAAGRLRERFLSESRTLVRLGVPGVPVVRATFTELATAYQAMDDIPGAESLEAVIAREKHLNADAALDVMYQLMEILEAVHAQRLIHRDLKPSNVLMAPDGRVFLIDFGAAREWHADQAVRHTVLFTPGYAPIEQLSERAKRSPATDIYGLCATIFHLLLGEPPPPSTDRVAGAPLPSIRAFRPDVPAEVAHAIQTGLSLSQADRPQSIADLRKLLQEAFVEIPELTLSEYDDKLVRLAHFRFHKRLCPSCGQVLEAPRPLAKHVCPVCRDGRITKRSLAPNACPACRRGVLHKVENANPLTFCPLCVTGRLHHSRTSLIRGRRRAQCQGCGAHFEETDEGIALTLNPAGEREGEAHAWAQWRKVAGRSILVHECDTCGAQLDQTADGRWKLAYAGLGAELHPPKFKQLYPEEWASVAGGLEPGCGNACCPGCDADFFIENQDTTLLGAHHDPFGFADQHAGRLLDLDQVRWIAVGKESGNAGLVCPDCGTELDTDGAFMRLVRSKHAVLRRLAGTVETLEDWQRIGQGLPTKSNEPEFRENMAGALVAAYERGEIGFDASGALAWRGPAKSLQDGGVGGTLVVDTDEVRIGGLLRKSRAPLDAITGVYVDDGALVLEMKGGEEPWTLHLEPVELTAHLQSGAATVRLDAENLARRMSGAVPSPPDTSQPVRR